MADRYFNPTDRTEDLDPNRDDYPRDLDRGRYRSYNRPADLDPRTERERFESYDDRLDERIRRERDERRERYEDRSENRYASIRDRMGVRETGRYAGLGPRSYRRSDASLLEDVCERLTWHDAIDPSDVDVSIDDGEITLAGTVESRDARRLAEDIAESVRGVRDVHNRLKVRGRAGAAGIIRTESGLAGARTAARGVATESDEKENLVTALFRTRTAAEAAVARLVENGISREDVSLLMSRETGGREFGFDESTKAPEGAATGAAVGGVLGAIAAGLAAIGTIAIPGLGLVAAGPLLATLAGAGAGGAAGTLIGGLVGSGIPEHEARFYSDAVERGGILLGVRTDADRSSIVEELLRHNGGESISVR
jgi:hypothetical protein